MGFPMSDVLAKLAISLFMKLLTEQFFSRAFVHAGEALADKTSNNLDDKIMRDIRKALDVEG